MAQGPWPASGGLAAKKFKMRAAAHE